jgi:WD40 repeat protein
MKRIILALILSAIFSMTFSNSTPLFASGDVNIPIGNLVYSKTVSNPSGNETTVYVRRTKSASDVSISVLQGQCASVDEKAVYIAVSENLPTSIKIYRFSDGTLFREIPWAEHWQACAFAWSREGNTLNLIGLTETTQINALTGETNIVSTDLRQTLSEQLPLKVPLENIVTSLDERFVLYNQCLNLDISPDGDFCAGQARMVIYDKSNGTVIQELSDTNHTILGNSVNFPPKPQAAFWSPSGRYLLYYTTNGSATPIRILDIMTGQFFHVSIPRNYISSPYSSAFRWSLDEKLIGFWMTPIEAGQDTLQSHFGYFDLERDAFNISSQGYNTTQQWLWSPDNNVIVFVDRDKNLRLLDLMDEVISTLDQEIYTLITWAE